MRSIRSRVSDILRQHRERDGARLVLNVAAAMFGLLFSVSAFRVVWHWENRLAEQEFAARANSQALVLQNGINAHLSEVADLRALFQSSDHVVSRREFTTFSDFLSREHPAILAMSWIPRVTRIDREAHERAAADEGPARYRIKSIAANGSLVPAADANEYFPILFSSKESLDSPIYGLDLNDGGIRQDTLERARDTGRVATSPQLILQRGAAFQGVDRDLNGFFVVLPVYRPDLPHDTVEDRRRNLMGFVQGVFQIGVMIESILDTMTMPTGLDLYVFAAASDGGTSLSHFHPSRLRKTKPSPLTVAELTAGSHWSGELRIGDSRWTLIAAPSGTGFGGASRLASWMVLIGSLSFSMIVAAYFWWSARHARRLQAANDQLDRTNGALDAANQQLLAQNTRFDAALNNMSQGLVMFDAAERIVVCNDRYIEMYGLSRDIVKPGLSLMELLRYRVACGQLTRDPEQSRAKVLAALADGKRTSFITEMADGRETLGAITPMAGGGWVVTHEDVTERRRVEAKICYMARHDALTKLPNRVLFHEELQRALANARRGERLTVLCLDLDHFKGVNDTLGHPIGDHLLTATADRLRRCVRDNDVVARLGGDEFAIVRTGMSEPTDATVLAARLIEAVSAPYDLDNHHIVVGLSIGIAVAPNDGLDPDQLLKNADIALYRAKADGRGTYRFFEAEMDARVQARRSLELDLRKAITKGEFELFYQPQVDVRTGNVSGFEALVRWRHPLRGIVAPLDFISLAEETGLIVPLGEWVLRQACVEAATWPPGIKVAVNLSPVQFKSKNLLSVLLSALAQSGLSPSRLELEITESALLQESDATLAMLHKLRDIGLKISMDDFGTGYSSLSYLRKFPFDKIKIDQSFIRDMANHGDSLAIVRAVTAMATSLGIVTTAEGVETLEQFRQLKLEGCQEVQGYLFSPPRPACEVEDLLIRINRKLKAA